MLAIAAALGLTLAAPAGARQSPPSPATTQASGPGQERLDRLTDEVSSQLRCPVCQGLSIQESGSDLAVEMRTLVREQLAEGKSPEEVKEFFVRGYGEWILLQPRAEGFNLAVYILPVVVLVGGAAVVVLLTRRWTRRAEQAPAAAPLAEEDPDLAPWTR